MAKKELKFKDRNNYLKYFRRERIRSRVNAKANYDVRRYYGLCYRCGLKCGINRDTGRYFHQCLRHRLIEVERYNRRKLRVS